MMEKQELIALYFTISNAAVWIKNIFANILI